METTLFKVEMKMIKKSVENAKKKVVFNLYWSLKMLEKLAFFSEEKNPLKFLKCISSLKIGWGRLCVFLSWSWNWTNYVSVGIVLQILGILYLFLDQVNLLFLAESPPSSFLFFQSFFSISLFLLFKSCKTRRKLVLALLFFVSIGVISSWFKNEIMMKRYCSV